MISRSATAIALLLLAVVLLLHQYGRVPSLVAPVPSKLTIEFADGVPYDKVWIGYSVLRNSGGRMYLDDPKPSGAHFYRIDTTAATQLKAAVWAPGCKWMTFEVVLGTSEIEKRYQCEKSNTVIVAGRVRHANLGGKAATISALYDASWACIFLTVCKGPDFCQVSCAMQDIEVATAKVEGDGTFKIELPDAGDHFSFTLSQEHTGVSLVHESEVEQYGAKHLGTASSGELILVPLHLN